MKVIKYELMSEVNHGTEENPNILQYFTPVSIRCKAEHLRFNEEIAKREAYNSEYTIEDDGVEETAEPSQEERIAELEEALAMLLNGVTE